MPKKYIPGYIIPTETRTNQKGLTGFKIRINPFFDINNEVLR